MNPLLAALLLGLLSLDASLPDADSPRVSSSETGAPTTMSGGSGWVPYDYGRGEERARTVSSGTLVLVAFGLIWLVLLVYLGVLVRRQRRLREEMEALLGSQGGPSAPAGPPRGHAEEEGV